MHLTVSTRRNQARRRKQARSMRGRRKRHTRSYWMNTRMRTSRDVLYLCVKMNLKSVMFSLRPR